MDLIIILPIVALIGFALTRVARETYNKSLKARVGFFLLIWITTTIIGAIVYGIAVMIYRDRRGIEPSPRVEVEPVVWVSR